MYAARGALERESLRDLEQHLRANGWVEDGPAMLDSFGGLELCLLRFLRARSLDVVKAAEALSATLAFRRKNEVGSVDAAAAVSCDGISNWWCGTFAGITPAGCPVTYWRFSCMDAAQLKLVNATQLKRFYIAWMEHGLALQREVAAHRPGGCPGMVDIYDMEGVRWSQMSSAMRLLSGVISVAQDHYPENLSQAFLVNVPRFFAGTWRLISATIDKRTQQKIVIRMNDGTDVLDAVLGCESGSGKTTGRDAVWRIGDKWLGGDSDEIVHLSAKTGWVHEHVVEVAQDCGHAGGNSIGRRLMWCFYVDGAAPVDFSVSCTPDAKQGPFMEELHSDNPIQVYPSTSCTAGPMRGCIADVQPGIYVLTWKCQPGRRARPCKLRRRCWLQSVDTQSSLGSLLCVGHPDSWSKNACTQAITPSISEAPAPSYTCTSPTKRFVGRVGPEGSEVLQEKPTSSLVGVAGAASETGYCSEDEGGSTDELASRSALPKVRFRANSAKFGGQAHVYDQDSDANGGWHDVEPAARTDDVSCWWGVSLCAGVGVGSLLCTQVLRCSSNS